MTASSTIAPVRGVHTGVPSFFRACCREAARSQNGGYFSVGRTLASSLGYHIPDDIENDEWIDCIEEFNGILDDRNDTAALRWVKNHLPKSFALIPYARHERFMAGIRNVYEEEGICA